MVLFFVKQPFSTETKEAFKREIQTQCMSFSGLLPIRMQMLLKITTATLTNICWTVYLHRSLYNKELVNWAETVLKRSTFTLINTPNFCVVSIDEIFRVQIQVKVLGTSSSTFLEELFGGRKMKLDIVSVFDWSDERVKTLDKNNH